MRISPEQRRAALRKRTQRGISERGQKGLGRKSVLDFSKAGDRKIVKYEVKSGKETNYVDILPFEITNSEYRKLRSKSGSLIDLDIGFTDYKLEIPVHKNVGENNDTFLCLRLALGKKCPVCEDLFEEWDKEEHEQNEKKVNSLKPVWRCFYNIYDYDGEDDSIQLWEDVAHGNFEKFLQEALETDDDGIVTFADLEMGSSINFKGREKKMGKNPYVEAHSFSFKKRDAYDESILKDTFPLDSMLIIPSYEQVAKAHLSLEEDTPKEEDSPEPASPKTRTRKRFNETTTEEQDKIEAEPEEAPPWDECPHGKEFGVDCNAMDECGECDEDLFQACAAKQDELKKHEKDIGQARKEIEEASQEEKQPTVSTRSRRRKSSSKAEDKKPSKRRSRRK